MKNNSSTSLDLALRFFENFSERSLMDIELARQNGRPIAGVYCIYAPLELIRAAGCVPIGLCGKRQEPIQDAEAVLPTSICPLIKSSYGYAMTDTCPFFSAADFIIAETTCDGKKKMYEFLGRIKPIYLMHLPYSQELTSAFEFWNSEVHRLAKYLTDYSGIAITEKRLSAEIELQNLIRELLWEIVTINADGQPILTGMQLLSVLESTSFMVESKPYLAALYKLRDTLQHARMHADSQQMHKKHRIILTGTPIGKGSHKVLQIIEESAATVVCLDSCSGMKGLDSPVRLEGNLLENISKRYLDISCACMSPNPGRMKTLEKLIHDFSIDGVVDLTWQGCHGFNVESRVINEKLDALEIPFLQIETGYSESDSEQIRTRIEAFLESLS